MTSLKSIPRLAELATCLAGLVHVLGEAGAGLAVVLERLEGRQRHRADGLGADQAVGVEGVGVLRVLGADRRPEDALDLGALGLERGELGASKSSW